jgi:hypothetical protein
MGTLIALALNSSHTVPGGLVCFVRAVRGASSPRIGFSQRTDA